MHPSALLARLVGVVAAAATACASLPALRPADPAAAHGDEARVSVGRVQLDVRAGGWADWPEHLQARLTPVEVVVRNGTDAPLRLRREDFALDLPDGRRLAALPPGELAAILRTFAPPTPPVSLHQGFLGTYPWPAVETPDGEQIYPYTWSSLLGPGSVMPGRRGRGPGGEGEARLAPGQAASLLVFFDAPADRLQAFTLEVSLSHEGGSGPGTARVPFTRQEG